MARGRRGERERYWRGVINEQRASGLSVAAFCREHDVSDALFYRWRRKLAERDEIQEADTGTAQTQPTKFVPIQLPSFERASGFEIVRPDGVRVLVPPQFDGTDLREILRALEEVSSC